VVTSVCAERSWSIFASVVKFFLFDLVFYEAKTMSANGAPYSYSNHTLEKVAKAKATLESFYANLITQHQERKNRFVLPKQH